MNLLDRILGRTPADEALPLKIIDLSPLKEAQNAYQNGASERQRQQMEKSAEKERELRPSNIYRLEITNEAQMERLKEAEASFMDSAATPATKTGFIKLLDEILNKPAIGETRFYQTRVVAEQWMAALQDYQHIQQNRGNQR